MSQQALLTAPAPLVIDNFKGEYEFLSNFFRTTFRWNGYTGPSSEAHYMADKTLDEDLKAQIYAAPSPGQAKRLGRTVVLRPGWDEGEKFLTMRSVLEAKFADPELARLLLATGDALLIEGNTWHDQVWGDCHCPEHRCWPGKNHLGRTLMALRSRLRGDPADRWVRVALTGHRPKDFTDEEFWWVRDTLTSVMKRLHEQHGTQVAISGMALGSDTWWAQSALTERVPLWSYVPFEAQAEKWPSEDQRTWRGLRSLAQREVVLGQGYDVRLLHARNELMIRDADLLVAVHLPAKTTGGTVSAIRKARAEGKTLLRVNPTAREVTLVPPG